MNFISYHVWTYFLQHSFTFFFFLFVISKKPKILFLHFLVLKSGPIDFVIEWPWARPYVQFLSELVTQIDTVIIGNFNIHVNNVSDPFNKAPLIVTLDFVQCDHDPTSSMAFHPWLNYWIRPTTPANILMPSSWCCGLVSGLRHWNGGHPKTSTWEWDLTINDTSLELPTSPLIFFPVDSIAQLKAIRFFHSKLSTETNGTLPKKRHIVMLMMTY